MTGYRKRDGSDKKKRQDIRSCWMTLGKGEDTLI
jgi:hypothetical protein